VDISREQRSDGGRSATSSMVPAHPNIREGEGRGLTDMRSARKADRKRCHNVSKSQTVPAEHKGDSAIPENSATGDSYFVNRPRLKTDR